MRQLILAGSEAAGFGDIKRPHLLPGDLDIALDIDRYDFTIRIDMEHGQPVARLDKPSLL